MRTFSRPLQHSKKETFKMEPEDMDWNDIWVPVFHVVSLTLFTIYLCICLWTGNIWCGLLSKRTTADISKASLREIKEVFQQRRDRLGKLVIEVEVARLEYGMFKFNTVTEDAEQQLFLEVNSARNELSIEQQNSDQVKRVLKHQFMRNPYDQRGARRLCSILEQYKNCQKSEEYKSSTLKSIKRKVSSFTSCSGCYCSTSCASLSCSKSCAGFSCSTSCKESFCLSSCCPDSKVVAISKDGDESLNSTCTSPAPKEQPSKLFMKVKTGSTCIVFPCVLIALDMFYSDTMVMFRILNYLLTIFQENNYSIYSNDALIPVGIYQDSAFLMTCLSAMVGLLVYIYFLSLCGLLSSHVFSCLRTNYDTGILMADVSEEESSTPIPLDSVTRYDLSLNESSSESAWQSCLQWSIYLVLQLLVGTDEVGEELSLTFQSLYVSGLLSTLSLTLAQMKANKLLTEYQTTAAQRSVYFLACLGNTVSSQLLATLGVVTIADAGMTIIVVVRATLGEESGLVAPVGITLVLLGFYSLIAIITILTVKRLCVMVKMFQYSGVLAITTEVERCWTKVGQLGLRWLTLQPLHLQTSKTRVITSKKIFYPGIDSEEYFFKENLVLLILVSSTSLILFITNNVIIYHHVPSTQELPYSSHISPARSNFLLICSLLIPGGWVLAQMLVRLFYHLDLGALTCGAKFQFDNLTEGNPAKLKDIEDANENTAEDDPAVGLIDNTTEEGNPAKLKDIEDATENPGEDDPAVGLIDNTTEGNGFVVGDETSDSNANDNLSPGWFGKLGKWFEAAKVNFLSKTGRWVEDEDDCGTDDEESKL